MYKCGPLDVVFFSPVFIVIPLMTSPSSLASMASIFDSFSIPHLNPLSPELLTHLFEGLFYLCTWMSNSHIKLNMFKTELLVFLSILPQIRSTCSFLSLSVSVDANFIFLVAQAQNTGIIEWLSFYHTTYLAHQEIMQNIQYSVYPNI